MCGIAGLFDLRGGTIDGGELARMTGAIAHRGPDQEGFHIEPGVGLGFRRLAIIDLAGGGQPMFNEDGTVAIVFNGEIYNHLDLRRELQAAGHRFGNLCDTEAIIHAWEEWGPACLDRLSGMFAFAIWDRNRRRLFLARDRLGKKPLYHATTPDGRFVFASEIGALAQVAGLQRRIDPAAVDDFFALGYIPDPRSIYRDIAKLPAAHWIEVTAERGASAPRRYWALGGDEHPIDEAAAAAELTARLRASVAARLIADVPLGAFLSGGIDSSAVVALAAGLRDRPLDTFTIGFPGAADERGAAALVAGRYGTLQHSEAVSAPGILEAARAQVAIYGEPFGDNSSVPTLAVCRLARRFATVALSGDGGDEVFGGYRRYRWHLLAEAVRARVPAGVRRGVIGRIARLYPKLDRAPRFLRAKTTLTELSLDAALGYYRTLAKTHDEARAGLFSGATRAALDGHDPAARFAALMGEIDGADPLRQAQYVDLNTYIPGDILPKVDRASMAVSLEVRCPILDHEFVAWGLALPAGLKRRGVEGKRVLRQAMAPLLPTAILARGKQGFATPLGPALRRDAATLRARLLGAPMADSGLFQSATIARLIDEHEAGRLDHSAPLWLLLVFEGLLAQEAGQGAAAGGIVAAA